MEAYQLLEQRWAEFNKLDPGGMVACSSGTAALHLAFEALQLPPGSQVLCPDLTMIACPRAITMAGLTPMFVDCGGDLLLDMPLACRAVRDLAPVHGLLAVHVYGRVCDMDMAADETAACIVEDLAEAHGVQPHPRTDAACWSFYRNKIIRGEEGGAVWFRDPDDARLARQLRSLGFTDAHDFTHVPRGHNYRMSNAHARLILTNLHAYRADIFGLGITGRRQVEGWYDLCCPAAWRMPPRAAPWVYDLRVPGMGKEDQDVLVTELRQHGIEARHCFRPCTSQEEYKAPAGRFTDRTTNAYVASREVIYLPITPQVREDDCRRAFEVILGCLGEP